MDISFATDSNLFSKVVEQLRKEGVPLLDGNIKARYMQYKEGKAPAPVEVTEEEVVAPVAKKAPKKK